MIKMLSYCLFVSDEQLFFNYKNFYKLVVIKVNQIKPLTAYIIYSHN